MEYWERFRTYKQRGEWVELLFMAQAALHGFNVSKVKSTSVRSGTGYFCQFRRCDRTAEPYTLDMVDLFAAYVIPVETWYLIPASVILKPKRKVGVMLYPVETLKQDRYKYEQYREAWGLLGKTREELAPMSKRKPVAL